MPKRITMFCAIGLTVWATGAPVSSMVDQVLSVATMSSMGSDVVGGVGVALDDSVYTLSDTAEVTITNNTDGAIVFAFVCDGFVEGLAKDRWRTVFEPDCSNIRVRPTRVISGKSRTVEFQMVPCPADSLANYEAFRMRLRFQFENNSGYHDVYSTAFGVNAEEP